MAGGRLDALNGLGEIIERSATTRTADVFRLRHAQAGSLKQAVGYRYLILWRFAEGDADGVTNAIDEQSANADRRFQTTVLALASFCNAQMQRERHALGIHRLAEQTHALHHHDRVGSLDADHHIFKMFAHTHA